MRGLCLLFLSIITLSCSLIKQGSVDDTTIFDINGSYVTVEEFTYNLNKNISNTDSAITKQDIDEYLELYINFKLKVKEAELLGLDTTDSYIKEFTKYKQDLIIGASLQVSVPSGHYDSSRLVNIGTNRWSFKPEVGVSKAVGPWTLEVAAAATLYTDNKDFFGGNTRSQDPLYSLRGHAIYSFPLGIWASLDATYFMGGRTTLNDERNEDLQRNWRVGGTLAFPVNAYNSVKLYVSSGVSSRTGNDYDLIGIAWQYRWGGGL